MEHRELIERRKAGRIHAVTMTRLGQQKFELAGSAHVTAVRALLVEHLSSDEREALLRTAGVEPRRDPLARGSRGPGEAGVAAARAASPHRLTPAHGPRRRAVSADPGGHAPRPDRPPAQPLSRAAP